MQPLGSSVSTVSDVTVERVLALEQQVLELRARTESLLPGGRQPDHDLITDQAPLPVRDRRAGERRRPTSLDRLTEREQQVLRLMASGCSNTGVAHRLHLSERTVEAATAHVFRKFRLEQSPLTNRRVLAVLTYLASRASNELPTTATGPGR